MNEQNITLHVSDDFTDMLVDQDGNRAACIYGECKIERADLARRIVACLKACELISTEELENTLATGGLVNLKFNFYRVKEQRDTLIEAIKAALEESPVSRELLQAALKEVKA